MNEIHNNSSGAVITMDIQLAGLQSFEFSPETPVHITFPLNKSPDGRRLVVVRFRSPRLNIQLSFRTQKDAALGMRNLEQTGVITPVRSNVVLDRAILLLPAEGEKEPAVTRKPGITYGSPEVFFQSPTAVIKMQLGRVFTRVQMAM